MADLWNEHHSQGDFKNRQYLRYDPELTKVPEGEKEDIEAIRSMFAQLITGDFEKHGHMYPVTHAKTLGLVKGKLIISDNLPPHLKQSLFVEAGEYPVLLRYSTNHHDVGTPDFATPSRAATIKIFDVDGERFPEGVGNKTQDFEFNSSMTVAELADARTAKEMIGILMKMGSPRKEDQAEAGSEFKKRSDIKLQTASSMVAKSHVAALPFYSQVPHRFGDYVAKHALVPATDSQKELLNETAKEGDPSNIMATKLKNYYSEREAVYLWQFQLLEDLGNQPVEYAGTPWDTEKYPYQTVAKLVFPKQDSFDYELKSFYEDNMRSNMWRGLRSLEPLGSTNRVRRLVYPYASKLREKLNGRRIIDVQYMEDLPGQIPDGAHVQKSSQWHPEIRHGHLGSALPTFPLHFPSQLIPSQVSSEVVVESGMQWTREYQVEQHLPPQFSRW